MLPSSLRQPADAGHLPFAPAHANPMPRPPDKLCLPADTQFSHPLQPVNVTERISGQTRDGLRTSPFLASLRSRLQDMRGHSDVDEEVTTAASRKSLDEGPRSHSHDLGRLDSHSTAGVPAYTESCNTSELGASACAVLARSTASHLPFSSSRHILPGVPWPGSTSPVEAHWQKKMHSRKT